MSIVLTKMVYVDGEDNLCCCEKDNYKICATRINNKLPCVESVIRVTEIERKDVSVGANSIVKRSVAELSKTLKHMKDFNKKVFK